MSSLDSLSSQSLSASGNNQISPSVYVIVHLAEKLLQRRQSCWHWCEELPAEEERATEGRLSGRTHQCPERINFQDSIFFILHLFFQTLIFTQNRHCTSTHHKIWIEDFCSRISKLPAVLKSDHWGPSYGSQNIHVSLSFTWPGFFSSPIIFACFSLITNWKSLKIGQNV